MARHTPLAAGRLRHRVTLQARVLGQDPITLEPVFSWEDVASVWAAIEPLSARDFIAAQGAQSEVRARITIRWRPDLDVPMRILHGQKTYTPQAWLPDPDSGIEYVTAPCTEGVIQV